MLRVSSSAAARHFYVERLGFRLELALRETKSAQDRFLMELARDDARIRLSSDPADTAMCGVVKLAVDDLDRLRADLTSRGVAFDSQSHVDNLGAYEIRVLDPDRNLLCFVQKAQRGAVEGERGESETANSVSRVASRFRAAVPQFTVPDVVRTAEYYRDVLGFQISGYWDGERASLATAPRPVFAIVHRDEIQIFFNQSDGGEVRTGRAQGAYDLYLRVVGVDVLAVELERRGADILEGPCDRPYGQRELVVRDCDGLVIAFGEASPVVPVGATEGVGAETECNVRAAIVRGRSGRSRASAGTSLVGFA